jgi:hypothetical protein
MLMVGLHTDKDLTEVKVKFTIQPHEGERQPATRGRGGPKSTRRAPITRERESQQGKKQKEKPGRPVESGWSAYHKPLGS